MALPWHSPMPAENGVHSSACPTHSGWGFAFEHVFPSFWQFVCDWMARNVHVEIASPSHVSRYVNGSHVV